MDVTGLYGLPSAPPPFSREWRFVCFETRKHFITLRNTRGAVSGGRVTRRSAGLPPPHQGHPASFVHVAADVLNRSGRELLSWEGGEGADLTPPTSGRSPPPHLPRTRETVHTTQDCKTAEWTCSLSRQKHSDFRLQTFKSELLARLGAAFSA